MDWTLMINVFSGMRIKSKRDAELRFHVQRNVKLKSTTTATHKKRRTTPRGAAQNSKPSVGSQGWQIACCLGITMGTHAKLESTQ